jgi:hypothetical protein
MSKVIIELLSSGSLGDLSGLVVIKEGINTPNALYLRYVALCDLDVV